MIHQFRSFALTLILVVSLNSNVFSQNEPDIAKLEWLIGIWVNHTDRVDIYEKWEYRDHTELSGMSYYIKQQDTVVLETIRIVKENDRLFYIPTVANQNNGKPVRFMLKQMTENEVRFENPEHDFPQIITYRLKGSNSLVARISSEDIHNPRVVEFPMDRIRE